MLNFTDLRKGNLLNRNLKLTHPETTLPDELVEVRVVHSDAIAYLYPNLENRVEPFEDDKAEVSNDLIPFAELEAIPLTEEWLVKVGVEMKDGKATVASSVFQWNGRELQPESADTASIPFQYLHQLQNHIADHTGKPLDINFNWK